MPVTPRLSTADAAVVKAMLARGDRQSDIAAFFKVTLAASRRSTPAKRS